MYILKVKPIVNPLLCPPQENDSHPVLEWNMLFPSAACHRSCDPSHVSWIEGRDEPATFPRVNELHLFTTTLSSEVTISARNRDMGVTCADVVEGLDDYLHEVILKEELDSLPESMQTKLSQGYHANHGTAYTTLGGPLGEAMLRLDGLDDEPIFGGLVVNEAYSMQIYGRIMPNFFEWRLAQNYSLPGAAENRVQEETEYQGEEESQLPSLSLQMDLASSEGGFTKGPTDGDTATRERATSNTGSSDDGVAEEPFGVGLTPVAVEDSGENQAGPELQGPLGLPLLSQTPARQTNTESEDHPGEWSNIMAPFASGKNCAFSIRLVYHVLGFTYLIIPSRRRTCTGYDDDVYLKGETDCQPAAMSAPRKRFSPSARMEHALPLCGVPPFLRPQLRLLDRGA